MTKEERVIKEIQDRSINGIAPACKRDSLQARAYMYFGSWENACIAAGVKPKGRSQKK